MSIRPARFFRFCIFYPFFFSFGTGRSAVSPGQRHRTRESRNEKAIALTAPRQPPGGGRIDSVLRLRGASSVICRRRTRDGFCRTELRLWVHATRGPPATVADPVERRSPRCGGYCRPGRSWPPAESGLTTAAFPTWFPQLGPKLNELGSPLRRIGKENGGEPDAVDGRILLCVGPPARLGRRSQRPADHHERGYTTPTIPKKPPKLKPPANNPKHTTQEPKLQPQRRSGFSRRDGGPGRCGLGGGM